MNGRLQCHHSQVDKLYYPHISLIPISPYPLFLHYLNGYENSQPVTQNTNNRKEEALLTGRSCKVPCVLFWAEGFFYKLLIHYDSLLLFV